MKIAANRVLSQSDHGQTLPPAWRTLYELAKLNPPQLSAALADGRVHPGMERAETWPALRDAADIPARSRKVGATGHGEHAEGVQLEATIPGPGGRRLPP